MFLDRKFQAFWRSHREEEGGGDVDVSGGEPAPPQSGGGGVQYENPVPGGGGFSVNAPSPDLASSYPANVPGVNAPANTSNPSHQSGGGGGGGGGGNTSNNPSSDLGNMLNSLLGSIGAGNAAAIKEAARQFDATFGLDKDKFAEAIRQYNNDYGLRQDQQTWQHAFDTAGLMGKDANGNPTLAGQKQANDWAAQQAQITGTFNGQQTEAARQARADESIRAAQVMASAQNDPFRQMEVQYGTANSPGLMGMINGITGQNGANSLARFQAPNGSAQGTGVLGATQGLMTAFGNGQPGQPGQVIQPGGGFGKPTGIPVNTGGDPNQIQLMGAFRPTIQQQGDATTPARNLNQQQFNEQVPLDQQVSPTQGNSNPTSGIGATGSNSGPNQFAQSVKDSLKSPNSVIARNYVTANQGTQNMITSAISSNTGVNQADVDKQIRSQLPSQGGPQFGMVQM